MILFNKFGDIFSSSEETTSCCSSSIDSTTYCSSCSSSSSCLSSNKSKSQTTPFTSRTSSPSNSSCSSSHLFTTTSNTKFSWNFHFLLMATLVVMALILTYLPQQTEAIYCWQCNSATDKFCEDVPQGPLDETKIHDCYKKMYRECVDDNNKLNYTFCRKQVQTIDKETRIIRACGFIRAPQDCYWTKNPPATTLVCQCEGDGCNRSPKTNQITNWISMGLPLMVGFFMMVAAFKKIIF